MSNPRRHIVFDGDSPTVEVRASLKRILLTSDAARCRADYELLDKYVHSVNYFSDVPPTERLRYLKAVKGIEIDVGEALFNIGDAADAFYCVMYGSLNVVMDFAHMATPTLNEFEEILNRARVHSSLLNPGGIGGHDVSQDANYVVRTLKALECFGDVGLLLSDQHRTASVVACERTLLMKIDKETFLELRSSNIGRELREKVKFLSSTRGFDHWDTDSTLKLCGRMEKLTLSYNDIVVAEGDLANHFYFVKHGECRLVKRFALSRHSQEQSFIEVCTVDSRHYFGAFEVLSGAANAAFSVLVSSPSAILYRVERADFRQSALKDPLTESLLRAEAVELAARIDEANVRQDLQVDATWGRYRRALANSILAKSEQDHRLAGFGPRSPGADSHIRNVRRPLPVLLTSGSGSGSGTSSSSNNNNSNRSPRFSNTRPPSPVTTKNVYNRRPSILVANPTGPQRPVRDKRWLEWAKARANEIVTGQDGQRIDPPDDQASIKSNIQWSKTSKVLGGLSDDASDKVTSAIVSLFSRAEGMKK
ncbi:hypothetical protein Gpo141_00006498 [Globisporangium polare]